MKYTVLTAAAIILFIACKKKETTEPEAAACPAISSSVVPAVVIDSFKSRYPSDSVLTWFRKDSIGYCAYFIMPVAQQTLAEFSNDGSFVQEEIDINHDGNFEDSTGESPKNTTGCECVIPE